MLIGELELMYIGNIIIIAMFLLAIITAMYLALLSIFVSLIFYLLKSATEPANALLLGKRAV